MGVLGRDLNGKRGMNLYTLLGFTSRKLQRRQQQGKSNSSHQGIVTEKHSKSQVIKNTQLMQVSKQ